MENHGKTGVISRFTGRRGRPKSSTPSTDTGTPETAHKLKQGLSSEALDTCLQRGIISRRQHWCGLHLRWLHTVRYGAPGISAADIATPGGFAPRQEDAAWRTERENEYSQAINNLAKAGQRMLIINICVYNEFPGFLIHNKTNRKKANINAQQETVEKLRAGLDILSDLWKTAQNIKK